jgi:hypothetical protein
MKKKAIVLKLDFRKAFDTISWNCLFDILEIRGFDQKWISWLQALTRMAKTAILLNGIPGMWIQIKRALRQGDPLSQLLFIILVNVLQQIIKRFSAEGKLKHPIILDQPCPILQYVNDTLILIQGCPDQACYLKEILDVFAATTRLTINYTKSTFVPINLDRKIKDQFPTFWVAQFPPSLKPTSISHFQIRSSPVGRYIHSFIPWTNAYIPYPSKELPRVDDSPLQSPSFLPFIHTEWPALRHLNGYIRKLTKEGEHTSRQARKTPLV